MLHVLGMWPGQHGCWSCSRLRWLLGRTLWAPSTAAGQLCLGVERALAAGMRKMR